MIARWWRGATVARANPDAAAPGLMTSMVNAFDILQDRIMRSRLAGDPPDALMQLKVGKIGMFEFHRADELIALGREAVRKAAAEIAEHIELGRGSSRRRLDASAARRFRRVAIYSRKACRSLSSALTWRLTTSPIETMPIRRPSSTTGRWRNRPSVIVSITWSIVASRVDGDDLRRHVTRHRIVERGCAMLGDDAHDVAFGKDAEHAQRSVGDDHRSHALVGRAARRLP